MSLSIRGILHSALEAVSGGTSSTGKGWITHRWKKEGKLALHKGYYFHIKFLAFMKCF